MSVHRRVAHPVPMQSSPIRIARAKPAPAPSAAPPSTVQRVLDRLVTALLPIAGRLDAWSDYQARQRRCPPHWRDVA